MQLRPAWLLASAIFIGWVIGAVGSNVCPSSATGPDCPNAALLLAQNNGLVIYDHLYFQLGSSIFVTSSLLDAAFNLLAVLILDRFTPPTFNTTRYFAIFFGTALVGNLFSLLSGPNYSSAGASGGIFGLYAAVFSFYWAEDRKIDITMLVLFLLIFVGSSFLIPNVDYLAHLGGAITGFICGPLLFNSLKKDLSSYALSTTSLARSKLIVLVLISASYIGIAIQFLETFQ